MLIIIAAVACDFVIGVNGGLPWRLPGDLARFKELTLGHTVIMGSSTYESLKKPLAGRTNIVLTRAPEKYAKESGAVFCENFSPLLEKHQKSGEKVFVIGGQSVYRAALPYCQKMYVTHVLTRVGESENAAFFPAVDWNSCPLIEKSDVFTDKASAISYYFAEYGGLNA